MGMDTQQRRIAVLIVLVTLALCAAFLAQGSAHLLAPELLPLHTKAADLKRLERTAPAVERTGKPRDAKAILARNIFDSKTGPLWPPPLPESPPEEAGAGEEEDPNTPQQACDNTVRLVAAVVSPRRPELSFAALRKAGKTQLYREGMEIDGKSIVSIHPGAVVLQPKSGLCTLKLFDKDTKQQGYRPPVGRPQLRPPSQPKQPARTSARRRGAISDQELQEGISKRGETRYAVARTLVDRVLQNQAELMRTARIIPHEQNGRVVGVKLYGIRRNSLLGRLGIQNGDVLRTINGYDMTAPDSALEAYARLRNAANLTVSITRRGQAKNLEYQVQ